MTIRDLANTVDVQGSVTVKVCDDNTYEYIVDEWYPSIYEIPAKYKKLNIDYMYTGDRLSDGIVLESVSNKTDY